MEERGKIEGDVQIENELKMHGILTGNVTVKRGGNLILHGIAAKNLVIEEGAIVEIPGTVVGDVTNNGGFLKISGTVTGRLIKNAGQTEVSPDAMVNT